MFNWGFARFMDAGFSQPASTSTFTLVRLTSIVATTWTGLPDQGSATGGGGLPSGGAAVRDEGSRHKIIMSSIVILLHV